MDEDVETRLRNFRRAPRCGAMTRAGTGCQRPAMHGQTISEREFFQKLAAVDPSYPAQVSALIDAAKEVGCAPELRRTYLIYAEAIGQSVNLGHVNSDGTVTIWGSASRDAQIGRPLGLEYMKTVASLLPSTDIKDSFADCGGWYVRYKGRSSIPLKELLVRKADWIEAMAKFVQGLQQVAT